MTGRILMALLCLSLVALSAAFVACGDDDDDGGGSEADKREVTETVTQLANAGGDDPEQVDFWLAHVTADLITLIYPAGRAECEANPEECVQPLLNPSVDPDSVEIDGDAATLTLTEDDGTFGVGLVKEDDVWKVDSLRAVSDEIAEGVEKVGPFA